LEEETRLADLYLPLDTDTLGLMMERGTSGMIGENCLWHSVERFWTGAALDTSVSGDWDARERQACAAVEALRAEPFLGCWILGPEAHPVHGVGSQMGDRVLL
jgi:hypothetical protein